MTLLEDTQALLSQLRAAGAPKITSLPVGQGRAMFQTAVGWLDRPAPALAEVRTLAIPGPGGPLDVRLYDPHGTGAAGPVVVFFHGGGWVYGNLATHNSLCAEIAHQLGLRVASVDYRLAPEHPFPAPVEDAHAATEWVAGSPEALKGEVTGIILAGDSAGGNLAAVTAQAVAGTLAVPVIAQFLVYPATDLINPYASAEHFSKGYMLEMQDLVFLSNAYVPKRALRADVRASPILAETLEGQPPALIFTAGLDPLRDQGRAYAAKLIQHGVPVRYEEAAGQVHGCFCMRKMLPSAHDQLTRCLAILKQMID